MKHPRQPTALDEHGTLRFKSNAIVRYLLDNGPFDMNHLAVQDFSDEDRCQFAQLIGYSECGYEDLSYAQRHEHGELSIQEVIGLRECNCGASIDDIFTANFEMKLFWLGCNGCGTQAPSKPSIQEATTAWNESNQ